MRAFPLMLLVGCSSSALTADLQEAGDAFGFGRGAAVEGEGVAEVLVGDGQPWSIPYQRIAGETVVDGDTLLPGDPTERGAFDGVRVRRWPSCEMPFSIDDDLPDDRAQAFRRATREITAATGIRFREDATAEDRVHVVDKEGCWSYVGRRGGVQELSLGENCGAAATHEIGHALGMFHEQARVDRDEHVEVFPDNIREKANAFQIYSWAVLHGDYDVSSVMQYPSTAFIKAGKTCTWRDTSGCSILERDGSYISYKYSLSLGDVDALAAMYGEDHCKVELADDSDVGSTFEDALPLMLSPESPSFSRREGATWEDRDLYRVRIVGSETTLSIGFETVIDLGVVWMDEGGTVLMEADDRIGPDGEILDYVPELEVPVEEGTYFLAVDSYDEYGDDAGYVLQLALGERPPVQTAQDVGGTSETALPVELTLEAPSWSRVEETSEEDIDVYRVSLADEAARFTVTLTSDDDLIVAIRDSAGETLAEADDQTLEDGTVYAFCPEPLSLDLQPGSYEVEVINLEKMSFEPTYTLSLEREAL